MVHAFYMPVKIFYGPDCIREKSGEIAKLGKKAFIVTVPADLAQKIGALQDVLRALEKENIEHILFDRSEYSPDIPFLNEMRQAAYGKGCDFVIGIGGGATLDTAKAATVLCVNDMDAKDLYSNTFPVPPLPLVAIPTTAGTGSEVTYNSVLTTEDGQNKKSFGDERLHAKLAFLDAKYTEGLPMPLARNTAVDALTHAAEGFLSAKSSPMGAMIAREVFRLFAQGRDALLGDSLTYDQRQDLLLAADYAGMVLAQERTLALHALSYPLSAKRHVHHGAAVGLPFAAFVEHIYPGAKERVDEMLSILGLHSVSELYAYVGDLLVDNETYTPAELEEYVQICAKAAAGKPNPVPVTPEDILQIYRKSLTVTG